VLVDPLARHGLGRVADDEDATQPERALLPFDAALIVDTAKLIWPRLERALDVVRVLFDESLLVFLEQHPNVPKKGPPVSW